MTRPNVKPIAQFQPMFNICGYVDIPTGSITTGEKGESIINGGFPYMAGFMGPGNSFKTGIMEGFQLAAADHCAASLPNVLIHTLDTEHNKQQHRQLDLAKKYSNIYSEDLLDPETGNWIISDILDNPGNKWFSALRAYFTERDKRSRKRYDVPFKAPKGKKISLKTPNFIEIDSLSGFEVESSSDMLTKHELGASESNMYYMRNGLVKGLLLKELLEECGKHDARASFTSHFGKDSGIQSGPPGMQQPKKLQHMPAGTKGKGISDSTYYLASHLWLIKKVNALTAPGDRFSPEYPYNKEEAKNGDPTELNKILMTMTRSKTGRSGFSLNLVVSQDEGLDHDMTSFMILKDNKFGYTMGGQGRMTLDLYPDVTFTRNTLRYEMRDNPLLAAAVRHTADLFMLKWFHPTIARTGLYIEPAALYESIKKKHDWNKLLDSRSWWTFDQYGYKTPFLSTVDILKIRSGEYTPYWF